jgi:hypothetical protein
MRIGEMKRRKMVRNIKIYYKKSRVKEVVELKKKKDMWNKEKKVKMDNGKNEVKMELKLKIVDCNLMIEYDELYENIKEY